MLEGIIGDFEHIRLRLIFKYAFGDTVPSIIAWIGVHIDTRNLKKFCVLIAKS